MGAFKRKKNQKYLYRKKTQKLHILGFHFETDNINDRRKTH